MHSRPRVLLADDEPGFHAACAERLGRLHELGRAVRRRPADVLPSLRHGASMFVIPHPLELTDESLFTARAPLAASGLIVDAASRLGAEAYGAAR